MSETVELNIEGMTCANCVREVTESLKDLPGVQILEVGIGTAKLAVEDSTAGKAALEAVRGVGYSPVEV